MKTFSVTNIAVLGLYFFVSPLFNLFNRTFSRFNMLHRLSLLTVRARLLMFQPGVFRFYCPGGYFATGEKKRRAFFRLCFYYIVNKYTADEFHLC